MIKMSFSRQVKKELISVAPKCRHCVSSQVYGMFLYSRTSKKSGILLHTENKWIADYYVSALSDLTSAIIDTTIHDYSGGHLKRSYSVTVDDDTDRKRIYRLFGFSPDQPLSVNRNRMKSDCCVQAFLRGVFLACGSAMDPEKGYHLEFVVPDAQLRLDLKDILHELHFSVKETKRKEQEILYLKESEQIEDLLTLMGATMSSLELMNVKIVKNVRNKVNRVTNCETANIGKTVSASSVQIECIRKIEQTVGLDSLPKELEEMATVRLNNPDMSLRELGMELSEPLSRSGVNHRLKRLETIAKELNIRGQENSEEKE